jgi:hypothetical protein
MSARPTYSFQYLRGATRDAINSGKTTVEVDTVILWFLCESEEWAHEQLAAFKQAEAAEPDPELLTPIQVALILGRESVAQRIDDTLEEIAELDATMPNRGEKLRQADAVTIAELRQDMAKIDAALEETRQAPPLRLHPSAIS